MIRPASKTDVASIRDVLSANAADRSLFQQSPRQIEDTLDDFVLAVDGSTLVGCAALHWHSPRNAEILAVAVTPAGQGRGTGTALMTTCIETARQRGADVLWLATAKPDYFARFGFRRMSRFRLPIRILMTKLRLVFQQPVRRWLPALFGRHTFMTTTSTAA